MNTIALIGEPGIGKSTVFAELTRDGLAVQRRFPIPHVVYDGGLVEARMMDVAQLGKERGGFSGTDALGMNIQPKAIAFIRQHRYMWLLSEGDRLANDEFFATCKEVGVLHLFAMIAPPEVAQSRRWSRHSKQNQSWVDGRITKTLNLIERWNPHRLDARQSPKELATEIVEVVHGDAIPTQD